MKNSGFFVPWSDWEASAQTASVRPRQRKAAWSRRSTSLAARPTSPPNGSAATCRRLWSAASAIGAPLQVAWGLAVAERLFSLWKKLGLAAASDGGGGGGGGDKADRHGLPDLPGVWCPPRPRAPARRPGRNDARTFLDLLLQQKRIHIAELRGGYAYCCLGVPNAADWIDTITPKKKSLVRQATSGGVATR